jgi:Zn-dependent protease with chaperone function
MKRTYPFKGMELLLCFNMRFLCFLIVISQSVEAQNCLGNPHPYAIEDISKICRVLGTPYVNVYKSNCYQFSNNNAAATTDGYGRSMIVYDPNFFEDVYLRLGRTANISILAHEVGHVISWRSGYYRNGSQSNWSNELEADRISGIAMRRLGHSLDDALMAMQYITNSSQGNSTHPPLDQRLNAISNGWYNGAY